MNRLVDRAIMAVAVAVLAAFMPLAARTQEMSVESFVKLDNDMDARINYPEKDPTGRTCAIIKVVNSNTGFVFDTGTVSVIKTKQATGEIWVYVQPGVKRVTISHPTLGVMRSWYFPMPIEEATVYEMRLATGTVHTIVEQKSTSAYLIINSTPPGADVTINGEWEGTTPFDKKYNQGERIQYRVSHPLYHDEVGEVLIDKSKCEVNAVLRPAHGSIAVTSQPAGATVILDNETQPRGKTPLTINEVASGQHRVRVQKPRYGQKVVDVTVTDGGTAQADAELTASFAELTVHSIPGATIKADGKVKGTGTATWEQNAGTCDIEVSMPGHRNQSRQLDVVAGQPQAISLEPVPMYGTLLLESDPIGAEVYIDGEKRGTTPDVFDKLLATEHSIKLTKAGCADFVTTVTIKEGEEQTLRGTLPTGGTLTVTTGSAGDDVYIDGVYAGKSPLTTTVAIGSHTAYAQRTGGKRSADKTFNVRAERNTNVTLVFGGPVEFTVNGVKFKMIPVEGGTFTRGANGKLAKGANSYETPAHQITLSDFKIGETEVTQALWKAVMGNNPSFRKGDDLPIEDVSWEDCQRFIKELNKLTGMKFRLPTETEWEYAAKGGNKANGYLYSGSDDIGSVAWYDANGGNMTHPVATKLPNELGIYDMTGNVYEWCSDWRDFYHTTPSKDPTGPSTGSYRIYRGGGFNCNSNNCRVSYRGSNNPNNSTYYIGFRLAL